MRILFFLLITISAFGQDSLGRKYINTRPESLTLKDGRRLSLVDDWWKYLQIVSQQNVDYKYIIRKGSVGNFILIEVPDTVNTWVMDVKLSKYEPNIPPPKLVTKDVNNNDPALRYSSGWSYEKVDRSKVPPVVWPDPFSNDDVNYTYQKDAWVELTFTGSRIEVYSELQVNHGKCTITITGPQTITEVVNMYEDTRINSRDMIKAFDLPHGTYTIRVTFSETNLSVSPRQDSMVFDGFRYVTKE